MNEKIIRVTALPSQIRAMTSLDADGDYNIYVNESLSKLEQIKAYLHEIRHISNGDYESVVNINHQENQYHKEESSCLEQLYFG